MLVMASLLAFPASAADVCDIRPKRKADTADVCNVRPERKPIADIEHWRCLVNDKYWLKFRVVEGEMRALRQPRPEGMTGVNTIQCWAWIEEVKAVE
jgi:hypothetical protein